MNWLSTRDIHCGVESLYGGGWIAWIGDSPNGRRAQKTFELLADVTPWLLTESDRLERIDRRRRNLRLVPPG